MITIPRNVADAIEDFRSDRWDNARIINLTLRERCYTTKRARVLDDYARENFDMLLEALVNGYEREKTAEEIAEEKRLAAYKTVAERYRDEKEDTIHALSYAWESYHDGYAKGIHFTLSTLGIEIEGVNV